MTARPVAAMPLAGVTWAGTPQRGVQGSLAEAAERTCQAWLAQDAAAVVGAVASVVLQIPGVRPGGAGRAGPGGGTAAALLPNGRAVRGLREPEPGRGYAELERRYVIAGTTERRRETVFLGFRTSDAEWQLTSCAARRSAAPGGPYRGQRP